MGSTDKTRQDVGLRLKAARELRDMTQQFVADLFDVTKGTVSAWETGGGDPGIYRLRRLAKLYGVTADALLWDETPSAAAQKVAVGYDALSEEQRIKFDNMWRNHFETAASDAEVAEAFARTSGGKYKPPAPIDETAPAAKSDKGKEKHK